MRHGPQAGHGGEVRAGAVPADRHPLRVEVEVRGAVEEPAHGVKGVVCRGRPGVVRRLAVVDVDDVDVELPADHVAPEVDILAVAADKAAAVHVEVDRRVPPLRAVEDDAHRAAAHRDLHALSGDRDASRVRQLRHLRRQEVLPHPPEELHQGGAVHPPHVLLAHERRKRDRFHALTPFVAVFSSLRPFRPYCKRPRLHAAAIAMTSRVPG